MFMGTDRVIDATKAVAMVEEDGVVIWIAPTTPGMVLRSEIFLDISAVPIGMPFGETVKYMLDVNTSMESLELDVVTMAHARDVDVAEE